MTTQQPVLLTARDPWLIEAIEASALALDVRLRVVQDSDELAAAWLHAPLRLVAPEMAGRAAWLGPQPDTFLVGRDAQQLAEASAELGHAVVKLPEASDRLAELLTTATRARDHHALVVSVVGASGGLGCSTLVAGLGLFSAKEGRRVATVELSPAGGGLDLLLGAETTEGLRWSDLAHARGELGDLGDGLVPVGGMGLLALSREKPAFPDGEARRAVLTSLRRTSDVVVLDATAPDDSSADVRVMVVGADVRSVAAARMVAETTGASPTGLVVRTGPGRRLATGLVAESIGVPLLGELREEPALARLAELGQPPAAAPARRFRKDVASIWKGILDG